MTQSLVTKKQLLSLNLVANTFLCEIVNEIHMGLEIKQEHLNELWTKKRKNKDLGERERERPSAEEVHSLGWLSHHTSWGHHRLHLKPLGGFHCVQNDQPPQTWSLDKAKEMME